MNSIKILGTGMYVPDFVATNEDYTKIIETSDEWITTRTGMKQRHISKDEPTWLLGAKAAKMALSNSGLRPTDIDMIVVSSVTPDYFTPSMASIIQGYLEIGEAMAFDINVACTAFTFGLDMARRYLATGDVENVLFISAESLTQLTNYQDRTTCVLFGDAAGACVVTKAEGIYGNFQSADASGVSQIYARIPRKELPFFDSTDSTENDFFVEDKSFDNLMYMNGREVYKFATKAMPRAIELACEKAGIAPDDLDMIFPHQANLRIIETAVKNLQIDPEKVFVNIEKYGNTSSATASIALHEAIEQCKIKRGDKICAVGFGAGLTYGANVFIY